jgi:hypothetical protein
MEQSNLFADIRELLGSMDRRITRLEDRVNELDGKIDRRCEALEHKLDQRFAWLVGLQITTILAFVSGFVVMARP